MRQPDLHNPSELVSIAAILIERTGVLSACDVSSEKLAGFLHAIRVGYHDNPYHNFTHCVHVLHGCYMLYKQVPSQSLHTQTMHAPRAAARRMRRRREHQRHRCGEPRSMMRARAGRISNTLFRAPGLT